MTKDQLSNKLIEKYKITRFAGHSGTLLIDDVLHMASLAIEYDCHPYTTYSRGGQDAFMEDSLTKTVLVNDHATKQDAWCWAVGRALMEI